jgi:hypothetical protein
MKINHLFINFADIDLTTLTKYEELYAQNNSRQYIQLEE